MGRIARVIVLDLPYHITQRGNYKQDVFLIEEDRQIYLKWLREYSQQYKTEILAYCLMVNHVHFIAVPHREDSFASTFNMTHMRYSQYFNRRKGTVGHLWQGRFYSCVLDDKHLYAAVRYVETNPARAGFVSEPWKWEWSSANIHIGETKDVLGLGKIDKFIDIENWKNYLLEYTNDTEIGLIRRHTRTGRPLGDNNFIKDIEKKTGRILTLQKTGRHRKK